MNKSLSLFFFLLNFLMVGPLFIYLGIACGTWEMSLKVLIENVQVFVS